MKKAKAVDVGPWSFRNDVNTRVRERDFISPFVLPDRMAFDDRRSFTLSKLNAKMP
ncbi:MAG: hypothetical protein WA946_01540 [Nitrospirota bacterium]